MSLINQVNIEIIQGDITLQPDIEAIVNAANAMLVEGGGVCGAIYRAAGPELEKESRLLAPIRPGEAVLTGAYRLPNKYIIHCLGPVYGMDKPEDELLAACYSNALKLADKYKIKSVAFPAISTGIFGYPIEEAADVVFTVISKVRPELQYVRLVRFVLFSNSDLCVYESKMSRFTHSSL